MQEGADAAVREVQVKRGGVQRAGEEVEIGEDADQEAVNAEAVFPEERALPARREHGVQERAEVGQHRLQRQDQAARQGQLRPDGREQQAAEPEGSARQQDQGVPERNRGHQVGIGEVEGYTEEDQELPALQGTLMFIAY